MKKCIFYLILCSFFFACRKKTIQQNSIWKEVEGINGLNKVGVKIAANENRLIYKSINAFFTINLNLQVKELLTFYNSLEKEYFSADYLATIKYNKLNEIVLINLKKNIRNENWNANRINDSIVTVTKCNINNSRILTLETKNKNNKNYIYVVKLDENLSNESNKLNILYKSEIYFNTSISCSDSGTLIIQPITFTSIQTYIDNNGLIRNSYFDFFNGNPEDKFFSNRFYYVNSNKQLFSDLHNKLIKVVNKDTFSVLPDYIFNQSVQEYALFNNNLFVTTRSGLFYADINKL